MDVSSHEQIELTHSIIPTMRIAEIAYLAVPGEGSASDIIVDLADGTNIEFMKYDHEAIALNLAAGVARTGTLEIAYLYRDANNFKQFNTVKFRGLLTDFRASVIYTALLAEDNETFIPEKLGIEALQNRWSETNYDIDGADHPFHELEELSFHQEKNVSIEDDQIDRLFKLALAVVKDIK
jgi:hypothetical protein